MSITNFVKRLQDIMRMDTGVDGDAQRISQIVWLLFLKIYEAKEQEWELENDNYKSIIPDEYRWDKWAKDNKDGKAKTGEELLSFVEKLISAFKKLPINKETPLKQKIVRNVFEDVINYMKDGILLRQVINVIDELDFEDYTERHAFGEIYETILKSLQSAGNAGEFYTPRAVTDFMVQMVKPQLGEKIADFACGTGGFLTSSLKYLEKQRHSVEDVKTYGQSIYGIECKQLPYILAITNMLLHDVDEPMIIHENALDRKLSEYRESDKFDIIIMNPPYGGNEKDSIKQNFPHDLRSSETADLFMALIMYRLKRNNTARAAVVLPDGFMFGADNAKTAIKKKLITEFNLHTVIRLPHSVFAPYTSITTNLLFFDTSKLTEEIWFYRLDMPEGYKNFSKTKPMRLEHFDPAVEWWNNRQELVVDGFDKAKSYSVKEIEANNYYLDLCGIPHEEEEILPPQELISRYIEERNELNKNIDEALAQILALLEN